MHLDLKLYLCTDRLLTDDLSKSVELAIKGGVTALQVREKNCSDIDFLSVVEQLKVITDKYHIPLIINDRIDIALAVNADGVHLGQDDLPCLIARKLIGENKIIGISCSTIDEALKAESDGADYIGVGAMFSTQTKSDTRSVSIDTLKSIKSKLKIPVIAIGGINQKTLPKLQSTGIDGIAVVSAILSSNNPQLAANDLLNVFNSMT